MAVFQRGSFRLFRLAGIDVFLHWSWLVVAFLELQSPLSDFQSQVWNVAEYLTLFAIVLLHEFGHSLACRQVGGTANRIVLWPLGGIAFVSPPPRPGAVLWSIAAGPLVNVALLPLTVGFYLASTGGEIQPESDPQKYLFAVARMNAVLLAFNLLPVYPLDGGQILQALLWFVIGRARSLLVVSVIGLVAGVAVVAAVLATGIGNNYWYLILAVFVAFQSLIGFQQARLLMRLMNNPRHDDAACPSCGEAPFRGELWACHKCRTRFDTFDERAVCPGCGTVFPETMCPVCRRRHPIAEWYLSVLPEHPTGEEAM